MRGGIVVGKGRRGFFHRWAMDRTIPRPRPKEAAEDHGQRARGGPQRGEDSSGVCAASAALPVSQLARDQRQVPRPEGRDGGPQGLAIFPHELQVLGVRREQIALRAALA